MMHVLKIENQKHFLTFAKIFSCGPFTWFNMDRVIRKINIFKIGSVIEPEKLPIHGSLVKPTVEPMMS